MNPYAFLAKLAGLGLVAGTAVAMVKLVEKIWPKTDGGDSTFEYTAVAGEFPPECEAAGEPAPDAPNENPVDAPPAVPVTDPLKIAGPADFQDWEGLGCRG